MSDVLRKIILDGFVISVGAEEYLELDKEINNLNQVVREYGIHVVENYSQKNRDQQMEELSNILKEIRNIREELYKGFEKSQRKMQDIESSLLNQYSLREDVELLRLKIKKLSEMYLKELDK